MNARHDTCLSYFHAVFTVRCTCAPSATTRRGRCFRGRKRSRCKMVSPASVPRHLGGLFNSLQALATTWRSRCCEGSAAAGDDRGIRTSVRVDIRCFSRFRIWQLPGAAAVPGAGGGAAVHERGGRHQAHARRATGEHCVCSVCSPESEMPGECRCQGILRCQKQTCQTDQSPTRRTARECTLGAARLTSLVCSW